MGLLKRREEKTATISVRVPVSVKTELGDLRKRAEEAGFDVTATLTEALVRLTKQVSEELGRRDGRANAVSGSVTTNGVANGNGAG
jgi:hypothetical protein